VLLLLAAKIAKYLRSIGFPQSGSALLYGDNKAAINMEAASRSTEYSRHIDTSTFVNQAIGERQYGLISLALPEEGYLSIEEAHGFSKRRYKLVQWDHGSLYSMYG
jgi:hypothetical protein